MQAIINLVNYLNALWKRVAASFGGGALPDLKLTSIVDYAGDFFNNIFLNVIKLVHGEVSALQWLPSGTNSADFIGWVAAVSLLVVAVAVLIYLIYLLIKVPSALINDDSERRRRKRKW